jgi:hypothetical protein
MTSEAEAWVTPEPEADPDTFPRTFCGCGYPITLTPDGWQHEVAEWWWGGDHDAEPAASIEKLREAGLVETPTVVRRWSVYGTRRQVDTIRIDVEGPDEASARRAAREAIAKDENEVESLNMIEDEITFQDVRERDA